MVSHTREIAPLATRADAEEVRTGGANGRRIRLSVQERPPNEWYVCVLCGEPFVESQPRRKGFCIKVHSDDDVTYLPVHTDCILEGRGDQDVRRAVRRYSTIIRRMLVRIQMLKRKAVEEAGGDAQDLDHVV